MMRLVLKHFMRQFSRAGKYQMEQILLLIHPASPVGLLSVATVSLNSLTGSLCSLSQKVNDFFG
jgi:hypothetical protein